MEEKDKSTLLPYIHKYTHKINLKLIFIVVIIFILGLSVGLQAEKISMKTSQSKNKSKQAKIIIPTKTEQNKINLDKGLHVASSHFGSEGYQYFVMYDGVLYIHDKKTFSEDLLYEVPSEDFIKDLEWTTLFNSSNDELFSFLALRDDSYLFILRDRNMFDYRMYLSRDLVSKPIVTFSVTDETDYSVPILGEQYLNGIVKLWMFGCWNCGGHSPKIALYNPENNEFRRLGHIFDFEWIDEKRYKYKKNGEIDHEKIGEICKSQNLDLYECNEITAEFQEEANAKQAFVYESF